MIDRLLTPHLLKSWNEFPVITITGPRQSGKTSIARSTFPNLPYVNLENIEIRQFAREDPKAFLLQYSGGVILDEFQNVPELTSWIQVIVDETNEPSQYILTGSRQFEVLDSVSQSLAGRTAMFKLLPFSLEELESHLESSISIDQLLFKGFYPRIYDRDLEPSSTLSDYVSTYIERDVRAISRIHDLSLFQRFVGLCAGRVGQLLNLSSLASDTGISHSTAQEWMTILQASYIIHLLPPYFTNVSKRLIKSPKLYFYDVGLASHLIGVDKLEHLPTHPLRGNLFENLIIMELIKQRWNQGKRDQVYFYRDSKGNEIDAIITVGHKVLPIEIKSGMTVRNDFFKGLNNFKKTYPDLIHENDMILVYGGKEEQRRSEYLVTDCFGLLRATQSI
jgi:hypothetical protein